MGQKNIGALTASKRRYTELASLFDHLTSREIPYAVIKGEPLSIEAYGRVGKRYSTDIDILVSIKNIADIKSFLLSCGYSMQIADRFHQIMSILYSHQSMPYSKMSNGINVEVDLNHDLFWGEYCGNRINIDEFLDDTITLKIYGSYVHTLSPIKMFIQLVLHNYRDMNSLFLLATGKRIQFKAFKDCYSLLVNNLESVTIEKLYSLSEKYEIIPYVYYMLYFMGVVFKDEIIQNYIAAFHTKEGEKLLNSYGLNENERREWSIDFQTRYENDNLFSFIRDELTDNDLKKIDLNKRIFGGHPHINT